VAAAYRFNAVHAVCSTAPSLAGCSGGDRELSEAEILAELLRLNR
jgi:hypothetical protein